MRKAEFKKYLSNVNFTVNSTLIVGHSVGGGFAKLMSIGLNMTSFSLNGPEIRMWYLHTLKGSDARMGRIRNLLTTGELFTGSEQGGTTSYYPLQSFPESPASFPMLTCLAAYQCQDYDYYKDYCNNMTNPKLLEQMKRQSKFPRLY